MSQQRASGAAFDQRLAAPQQVGQTLLMRRKGGLIVDRPIVMNERYGLGQFAVGASGTPAVRRTTTSWPGKPHHAISSGGRADEVLDWMADLIEALACTGLRTSELASLRRPDEIGGSVIGPRI